jgi:outer membrane immunogenic protein
MRRWSIAVIAAASTIALMQMASAADLPVKAPRYAPPPPPPPFSWTGFYIGGHLGGAWETRGTAYGADPLVTIPFDPVSLNLSSSAFLGGVQMGYNFQFNPNWVAGIEADASWTHLDASANSGVLKPIGFGGGPLANSTIQFGSNVDWLVSLRARLGYTWDNNWMAYATGGAAWAEFKYNANFICPNTTCAPPHLASSRRDLGRQRMSLGWRAPVCNGGQPARIGHWALSICIMGSTGHIISRVQS